MKTLLAALIALGALSSTASAQHVRVIGHGYGYNSGPAYCAPDTVHVIQRRVSVAPTVVAPVQQAEAPAPVEAPAAAPEAPADDAAPLQAPLPPK